jgi:hypothetical protein
LQADSDDCHSRGVTPRHPDAAPTHRVRPESFEIRVRGRIGKSIAGQFDGFDAMVEPAETVLRGEIRDQAQLLGLLTRIESLGLELVEVRQVGVRRDPVLEDRAPFG